jgi:protein HOOK3
LFLKRLDLLSQVLTPFFSLRKINDERDNEQYSKNMRDQTYIAELEADLDSAKTTLENYERQLRRLKSDAVAKQELRDELQLVKTERDDLAQREKGSQNLRKKIQSLQEQEKAFQKLQKDYASA